MDLRLDGRRALVTGASRGIGKDIALALAREGCDVVVTARGHEELHSCAAELAASTGRRVVPVVCDTSSGASIQAMVHDAAQALGGIDILVNSAARPGGPQPPPSLANLTAEDFWEDMNVKVLGYMIEAGWGRIINISGLAARSTGATIGSMRNVAVAAMTKNLADELGPQGINVTTVHPGSTRTEATEGKLASLAQARGFSTAEAEHFMARNSVGRMIDSSEVANIVAFLASPLSIAINGDAIAAGGGTPGSIFY